MFEVDHAAPPAELSFRSIGKPIPRNEDKRLATGRAGDLERGPQQRSDRYVFR